MKISSRILLAFAICVVLGVVESQAGLIAVGPVTNASGQLVAPSAGSYDFTFNSGTLGANVDPTSDLGGGGQYREQTLLTNWGDGIDGGTLDLRTSLLPDGGQNLGSGTGYTVLASFAGTGKMSVFARDPWNNTLDGFGGLGFLVTSGNITELSIIIRFDYALSPRVDAPVSGTDPPARGYGPYSSITGYKKVAGGSQVDFQFSYELLDENLNSLYPSVTNPIFISGPSGFPYPTPNSATSQLWWSNMRLGNYQTAAYGQSFGVHNFGDGTTTDDYVGGINMIFRPVGGTNFEVNSQFNYSVDGTSPLGQPEVVPEPSAALLSLLAVAGLAMRRHRA